MNISKKLQEAFVGYFYGKITQDQADELLKWINTSEENLLFFKQLWEIWYSTSILSREEYDVPKALKDLKKKVKERNLKPLPSKVLHLRISILRRVAAIVLLIISLGIVSLLIFKNHKSIADVTHYIETSAPLGSKSMLTLSDGTEIWLNADTRLRYNVDYAKTNRDVFLEGEAYFTVVKSPDYPFRVITSELAVTALGTSFNVKAYQDEETIETTLEEGQLRIDALVDTEKKKDFESVILNKNQNAVYHKQGGNMVVSDEKDKIRNLNVLPSRKVESLPIKIITVADTKPYTSWKDSRWVFKNEKLNTLAPKLERRYDVKIIFADSSLLNYAFTGIIEGESLEQVLKAIRYTAPIKCQIDSKEVILYEDKEFKNKINIE